MMPFLKNAMMGFIGTVMKMGVIILNMGMIMLIIGFAVKQSAGVKFL